MRMRRLRNENFGPLSLMQPSNIQNYKILLHARHISQTTYDSNMTGDYVWTCPDTVSTHPGSDRHSDWSLLGEGSSGHTSTECEKFAVETGLLISHQIKMYAECTFPFWVHDIKPDRPGERRKRDTRSANKSPALCEWFCFHILSETPAGVLRWR